MKKKTISAVLAIILIFSCFNFAFAAGSKEVYSFSERSQQFFYQTVDKAIFALGKVLNAVIPGLNWSGKIQRLADCPK